MGVTRQDFSHRFAVGSIEYRRPTIGGGFVRTKNAEVALVRIQLQHIADVLALDARRLGVNAARLRHLHSVGAEVRQAQVAEQQAAVGVRVGAHAPLAFGGQLRQLRIKRAVGVEQCGELRCVHPITMTSSRYVPAASA